MPHAHETYFEQEVGCGATTSPFGGQIWLNWFDFNESTPKTDSANSRLMKMTGNAKQEYIPILLFWDKNSETYWTSFWIWFARWLI